MVAMSSTDLGRYFNLAVPLLSLKTLSPNETQLIFRFTSINALCQMRILSVVNEKTLSS